MAGSISATSNGAIIPGGITGSPSHEKRDYRLLAGHPFACPLLLGNTAAFGNSLARFVGNPIMEAETLNCPMCGAPQATDATKCDHCGARLATIACPSCFGLVFEGSKFFSHCGANVEQPAPETETARNCPHCKVPMGAVTLGGVKLLECAKCEGIWLDNATFEQICADREKQSVVLGMPG